MILCTEMISIIIIIVIMITTTIITLARMQSEPAVPHLALLPLKDLINVSMEIPTKTAKFLRTSRAAAQGHTYNRLYR